MTEEDSKNNEITLNPINDEKLKKLNDRKEQLEKDIAFLEEKKLTQYNRTDPDAKVMRKPAHNFVAYNTQIAVDASYKLIIATGVSSDGNDLHQLHLMATAAKKITGQATLTALADSGYYTVNEIAKCVEDGITPYVPIPRKQNKAKKAGYFIQDDFHYDKESDCFTCPEGQLLTRRSSNTKPNENKRFSYRTKSKLCRTCSQRKQCIPDKTVQKTIVISEHFNLLQEHKTRVQSEQGKEKVKQRSALAEHPFGTIKQTLGWSHYLVRGLEKVSGEHALIMLTYNFRRILNIIGVHHFKQFIFALKTGDTVLINKIKAAIATKLADFDAFLAYIWLYLCKMKHFLGDLRIYIFCGRNQAI